VDREIAKARRAASIGGWDEIEYYRQMLKRIDSDICNCESGITDARHSHHRFDVCLNQINPLTLIDYIGQVCSGCAEHLKDYHIRAQYDDDNLLDCWCDACVERIIRKSIFSVVLLIFLRENELSLRQLYWYDTEEFDDGDRIIQFRCLHGECGHLVGVAGEGHSVALRWGVSSACMFGVHEAGAGGWNQNWGLINRGGLPVECPELRYAIASEYIAKIVDAEGGIIYRATDKLRLLGDEAFEKNPGIYGTTPF